MNTDRMTQILRDVTLGVPAPENESEEDARVRARLTKQVRQIASRGHIVDIPPETP
jgi:hypothetical protein